MDQDWVVNVQTNTITKQEGELIDLELQVQSVNHGCKTTFEHINKDLEALDGHINHHSQECEQTECSLQVTEGKVTVLWEQVQSQWGMIEELIAHVDAMEGKLCWCASNKGKERMEEILGSPLVLDHPMDEDRSKSDLFFTPSMGSSSLPPAPSPALSDPYNTSQFGIGFILKRIEEAPAENKKPIPIHLPSAEASGLNALVVVCGQCAVHTLGCPKSTYHPYSFECCALGVQSSYQGQPSPQGSDCGSGGVGLSRGRQAQLQGCSCLCSRLCQVVGGGWSTGRG